VKPHVAAANLVPFAAAAPSCCAIAPKAASMADLGCGGTATFLAAGRDAPPRCPADAASGALGRAEGGGARTAPGPPATTEGGSGRRCA
jgi:hypothetical protein